MTHTRGVTYEIILVDNASTETTPDQFAKKFPSVTMIASTENLGFSKGNNAGIAKANGEVILLLNSDTLLKNDAVTICYQFLKEHPDTGVVSARLEYPDGSVQHNCQRFPSVRVKLFELLRLQKVFGKAIGGRVLFGYFFDHQTRAFPDWVWGTFFMFPKRLLAELPEQKLADTFFMYVEDMQWCMEFQRRSHRVAFEPCAIVIHLSGKSGGSRSTSIAANIHTFMTMYYSALHRRLISLLDFLLAIRIKNNG